MNKYNFLVTFPNGDIQFCYTYKEACRKVRRWNAKYPEMKTCSLYSVRRLEHPAQPKIRWYELMLNYLIGRI